MTIAGAFSPGSCGRGPPSRAPRSTSTRRNSTSASGSFASGSAQTATRATPSGCRATCPTTPLSSPQVSARSPKRSDSEFHASSRAGNSTRQLLTTCTATCLALHARSKSRHRRHTISLSSSVECSKLSRRRRERNRELFVIPMLWRNLRPASRCWARSCGSLLVRSSFETFPPRPARGGRTRVACRGVPCARVPRVSSWLDWRSRSERPASTRNIYRTKRKPPRSSPKRRQVHSEAQLSRVLFALGGMLMGCERPPGSTKRSSCSRRLSSASRYP
jgi:hypothetical protein